MLLNCGAGEDSWESLGLLKEILKEINPEYALEGLMLKLNLQYFGYLMWKVDLLEKTLMLGTIEGRRRRKRLRIRWLDGITKPMDMSLSILRELVRTRRPGVMQSMGLQRVGHDWADWQVHSSKCYCIGKIIWSNNKIHWTICAALFLDSSV